MTFRKVDFNGFVRLNAEVIMDVFVRFESEVRFCEQIHFD